MMSSSLLGKRILAATGRIDLTTIVLCVSFCLVLLIHQITLSSLTKKSSSSSSTLPNSTSTTIPSELNTVERKAGIIAPQLRQPSEAALPVLQLISCDRTHKRYDICSLNGPTIMDPTKSNFHVKWETNLMNSHIKELTLLATSSQLEDVHCDIHHRNPALVFSSGGYTGNPYHDFDDGFIPLFITLRTAYPSSEEQPILVISKCEDWWLSKYSELLEMFSPYPIINLDNETATHCFPSVTIGLISHGFMTIDPTLLPNSETLRDFIALLESAYAKTGLQTNPTISALSASTPTPRPRLLVVSRTGENVGRVMSNQAEVVLLAKEIGFDVKVFEPTKFTSVTETYKLPNSAHAMLGVHGAAMSNLLFLRPGSIFMQVVPIGTDWAAEVYYMEYKIKVNESTLVYKYGKDSMVVKDPKSVSKKDWSIIKKIYLKEQDVRVNLVRFEKHLRKAYKKAKKFMDKVG
ncbi:hypothetical protein MKW98_006493 [Papaver atlanticum]|uniref:Glycosyltransferase 61 catalytic domain-containing protein n=1 Tax=Papaver atlanticum TaxID=357466 RepID=A0AAD4XDU2_9MAGN|nr:hypothetical protein MKW98_006493 [Papaver atlanticum]